jgi:tRNA modification GTPase
MFSSSDTIAAIATPTGRGGIGVVRISGPESLRISGKLLALSGPLRARVATLSRLVVDAGGGESGGRWLDEVVATYFAKPASYTGEDVVEISGHGSPVVLREVLGAALSAGARLAEPGEFTFRSFLNGRIDLVQAEAVRDLVEAVTPLQARMAFDQLQGTLTTAIGEIDRRLLELIVRLEASLDFPEEGYQFVEAGAAGAELAGIAGAVGRLLAGARRGRMIREGLLVALAGRTNTGKSSLFNYLVGAERAIVTEIPGTTRDLVRETVDMDGLPVTLVDTAGFANTTDPVESEGVKRASGVVDVCELVVVMLDRSRPLEDADRELLAATRGRPRLIVVNKIDLPAAWDEVLVESDEGPLWPTSLVSTEGTGAIRDAIVGELETGGSIGEPVMVTNLRHVRLLERVGASLERARRALEEAGGNVSEEFVLADLQEGRRALEEITGARTPDDILNRIFSQFCIGK